jgi:hypothetical protein
MREGLEAEGSAIAIPGGREGEGDSGGVDCEGGTEADSVGSVREREDMGKNVSWQGCVRV